MFLQYTHGPRALQKKFLFKYFGISQIGTGTLGDLFIAGNALPSQTPPFSGFVFKNSGDKCGSGTDGNLRMTGSLYQNQQTWLNNPANTYGGFLIKNNQASPLFHISTSGDVRSAGTVFTNYVF